MSSINLLINQIKTSRNQPQITPEMLDNYEIKMHSHFRTVVDWRPNSFKLNFIQSNQSNEIVGD